MKILYIHQYFKSPREPGGTRSYWISKALIEAGHEVVMITQNKFASKKIEYKDIDGIKVIYLKNWYSNEMSISSRVKSFFNFMIKSSSHSFKVKDIDLVIATSTPLSVGFPALLLRYIRKTPYIFEVRDLWPEVPIQMGALKNPFTRKVIISFEKHIYKKAKHIIALSPGMKAGVVKHVPSTKVTMIPNMAKIDQFWPREKNEALIEKFNFNKESFKVMHFGAMGIANGLLYIMKAAKILSDLKYDDIEFVFLGEGKAKQECVEYANNYQLKNVIFMDRVAMEMTSEIVNICDVSIVPFLNIPILSTNSPNKLFDSLSAGKPIIVNSNGWTRKMVETNKCGVYVDPDNPSELADKIIYLKNHPELVKQLGLESRKLAENKYDKSILCKQFVDIVDNLE